MSASTTPVPDPAGGSDPLRELLRRRIAAATAEAAAGGAPGEAALAEIKRLEELLRIREALRPPPRRSAAPTVLVAVAIALLVGALLALRMPTTEATMTLDLTSLAFRTAPGPGQDRQAEATLTGWTSLDRLGVEGIDEIVLEQADAAPETSFVELRAGAGQPLSLRPIAVPIGAWVRVEAPDGEGGVTIELAHPTLPLELRADLRQGAELDPPELAQGLDPALPAQPVLLRASAAGEGGGCARLVLRLLPHRAAGDASEAGIPLSEGLAVDALLLSRLDPDQPGSRPASTLLGGSLRFDEVGGEPVALQRGQRLELALASPDGRPRPTRLLRALGSAGGAALGLGRVTGVAPACQGGTLPEPLPAAGRIDRIELAGGMVKVAAGATVARVDAGSRSGTRPLMPTLLEWLRSWPEIPLYWGTLVTLCTLAWTGLAWWRGGK